MQSRLRCMRTHSFNCHPDPCHRYLNGWGYVVRTHAGIRYAHVPSELLAKICSRASASLHILLRILKIFEQITAMLTCAAHSVVGILRQLCRPLSAGPRIRARQHHQPSLILLLGRGDLQGVASALGVTSTLRIPSLDGTAPLASPGVGNASPRT